MITRPYPRVNGLKTIPFPAAHTRIANIWEYLPWGGGLERIVLKVFLPEQTWTSRTIWRPDRFIEWSIGWSTTINMFESLWQLLVQSSQQQLSDVLEQLQKRALRIIYPFQSYSEALRASGLPRLSERREHLTRKLFVEVASCTVYCQIRTVANTMRGENKAPTQICSPKGENWLF